MQDAKQIQISPTLTIKYEDVGQGGPVVLLHAFPLSRAMWQSQLEELSAEYRVIAPDLRGFGGTSPFEGTPSIAQMADDVASLLDALNIEEPVVLGGLSMGGYVAFAFAHKYPQRLRALILADTRAEPDTDEAKVNRNKMIELASTQGSLAVVEQMVPKLVADVTREKNPQVIETVTTIGAAQSPEDIAGALAALRDRPDARVWLSAISIPTLVIVGKEDELTPPAMSQALENAIQGAWLVQIENAGHLSNLEQPESFNKAVLAFLRSVIV